VDLLRLLVALLQGVLEGLAALKMLGAALLSRLTPVLACTLNHLGYLGEQLGQLGSTLGGLLPNPSPLQLAQLLQLGRALLLPSLLVALPTLGLLWSLLWSLLWRCYQ
jgi:hypothetical protein